MENKKPTTNMTARRTRWARTRIAAALALSLAGIANTATAYFALTGNAQHVAQITLGLFVCYLGEIVSKGCFR